MVVKIFTFLPNIPLGILLLLLATIVFDVLHILLHRLARSNSPFLQKLGALHTTHHCFLDTDLRIHEELMMSNVYSHVIPEFIVQVAVTLALIPVFPLQAVWVALAIEVAVFVFIMWDKPGFDVNHKAIDQLKAYRPMYFCVPEYHLLHHVYPSAHFSSWIKTLDHLLCTGMALQGRRVFLTGETVFARKFAQELENYGVVIVHAQQDADILLLCHKPESSNDYQGRVEHFYKLHSQRRIPVEVWALVADKEFADKNLSAYAQFAQTLFNAEKVIYRHLVADGYESDPGLVKNLLKGIRRGFNYVPARCDIAMLKHYGQFVLK